MEPELYYRIYCELEGWTYGWSTGAPTQCFNNISHPVNPDSVLEMPNPNTPSINSQGIMQGLSGIQLQETGISRANTIYKKTGDPNIYWKGDSEIIMSNIFGTYYELFSSTDDYSTTSDEYTTSHTFTTQVLSENAYKLNWCVTWALDGSQKGYIRLLIDSDVISELSTTLRGSLDDKNIYTGFAKKTLTAGTHTISVQCKSTSFKEISISQVDVELTLVL